MTDKPKTPEESNEQKDDLYDVFDELRESLAADEEQEEQSSGGKKKGFLELLQGVRMPKFSKKKREEKFAQAPVDEDVGETTAEEDAEFERRLAEERLALEYLAEAETLIEESEIVVDEEDIPDEIVDESEPEEVVKAPRLSETLETNVDHIRDIALEDYTDEELESVDERKRTWLDFFQGRARRAEWLLLAFAGLFVGGIILVFSIRASGGLHFSEPEPTRTPDPNIPIPTSVQLPGGWTFRLSKGSLNAEGRWEPYAAEWLQGTEICKWIALPWSTQLEAVIRTLEAGDEIEVTMSNYDVLTYHVYSRQEVDAMQAEELNLDVPSILIVLANEKSDQKWIVTAVLDYEDTD